MSISKFGVEHCSHVPGISSASVSVRLGLHDILALTVSIQSSFPFPYEVSLF